MDIICKLTGFFCSQETSDPETEIHNKQLAIQKERQEAIEAKRNESIKDAFKMIKKGRGSYDKATRTHSVNLENDCYGDLVSGSFCSSVDVKVSCKTGDIEFYDTINKDKLPEDLQKLYGKICRTE